MAVILREAGLAPLVPDHASLELLAEGFSFTEGPLWIPHAGLLFQDLKTERTHLVLQDGTCTTLRTHTNAANGQTFDADGHIVFCEQNGRRVSRMRTDGSHVESLVEEFQGKRLNSPNDLVARSDGALYFTDPAYGAPPDRPLDFQGVYRLDPDRRLHLLVDDFEKPNGLAFAPDEKTLYICDTARYHVRAFPVRSDGTLDTRAGRVLAEMDPGQPGGPDGIKVDREGRLYVAVALGVWVFEPDGHLLGILATPQRPSNLAWSGPNADTLALTVVDEVYRITLGVKGCAPPFQPRTETTSTEAGSPPTA
jgi:gluconolactonase